MASSSLAQPYSTPGRDLVTKPGSAARLRQPRPGMYGMALGLYGRIARDVLHSSGLGMQSGHRRLV